MFGLACEHVHNYGININSLSKLTADYKIRFDYSDQYCGNTLTYRKSNQLGHKAAVQYTVYSFPSPLPQPKKHFCTSTVSRLYRKWNCELYHIDIEIERMIVATEELNGMLLRYSSMASHMHIFVSENGRKHP